MSITAFSLSDHRRELVGPSDALPEDYFRLDPAERSEASEKLRVKIKDSMLSKIGSYFTEDNGQVAIYDANNITLQSRYELREYFKDTDVHIFFIGECYPTCRRFWGEGWTAAERVAPLAQRACAMTRT